MKKRLTDKLGMIIALVVLLGVFSGALFKGWSMESKLNGAVVKVASVEDKVRKINLRARRWEVQARIAILEGQMRRTDNDYFPRKIKELEKERDCLEDAVDIKDKHPVDCRP